MATPVTLSGQSSTSLPDWYTNYAQQILSNAQALSARPYTTYQGPRLAQFTPEQLQGFTASTQAAGAYEPALAKATEATTGALSTSPLETAQPYLSKAAQSSVENIGQYMNPFTEQVVNRIGQLGARTLREQLMPEINAKFIGAGQFGGSRQAEAIGRALRDVSEGTLAEQAKALQSGYTEAGRLSSEDLSRMGTLASYAGNLGERTTAQKLAAAQQLGALGEQAQTLGLRGAEAIGGVGATKQGMNQRNLELAYADFLKQQGYPAEQINTMMGALQGTSGAMPKLIQETKQELPTEYPSSLTSAANVATALGVAKDLGLSDIAKEQLRKWLLGT